MTIHIFLGAILFFVHSNLLANLPLKPLDSEKAVKQNLQSIYQNHNYTFLCQYPFDRDGQINRVTHVETPNSIIWATIVSKKDMAKNRPCYSEKICINNSNQRYKGISCCKRIDQFYNIMLFDLHNRLPFDPQLYKVFNKAELIDHPNEKTTYFICQSQCDKKCKNLCLTDTLKGEVSRIILYMADTYNINLDIEKKKMYLRWHEKFPPSPFEKRKNLQIASIQGNRNPYIG